MQVSQHRVYRLRQVGPRIDQRSIQIKHDQAKTLGRKGARFMSHISTVCEIVPPKNDDGTLMMERIARMVVQKSIRGF